MKDNSELTGLFSLLGEKWTLSVLSLLLADGVHRFGAMRRAIPGVSQRMLAQTLRRLESAKLITRTEVSETPRCVVYEVTALGKTLYTQLYAMQGWLEQSTAPAVVT
jgi:DNA-binding HxlR family transcriptional regulator